MLVVGAMCYCFAIRREKINVKHWMNAPLRGKFETVIDGGHHLDNLKRSVASRPKFGRRLGGTEILAF